jgi:hypothetical protein
MVEDYFLYTNHSDYDSHNKPFTQEKIKIMEKILKREGLYKNYIKGGIEDETEKDNH